MRITRDELHTSVGDLCTTCTKDIGECVLKKALSNYHSGGDISLSLILTGCPEYRRTESQNTEILWDDFMTAHATLMPNEVVRFNTEVNE